MDRSIPRSARRRQPTWATLATGLVLATSACSSSDTAQLTVAPTTSLASVTTTTAPAPTTTATPTTSTTSTTSTTGTIPEGQQLALGLIDGDLRFTITLDTTASTARFLVEPIDASASPRWESVVSVDDVPNASGHRPYDGLVPVDGTGDAATEEANRQLVGDYVRTALVEGRWEDVDGFFRDGGYALHGPLFTDGLESVRSFFIGLRDAGAPFLIADTALLLADGPYVLAINRHDGSDATTAYWDLWRVDDGAIVEHWDATMQLDGPGVDAWFEGVAP